MMLRRYSCLPLGGSEKGHVSYETMNKKAPVTNAEGGNEEQQCLGKSSSEGPARRAETTWKVSRPARGRGTAVPRAPSL